MPFHHFDQLEKEYATPKYSTAFGEMVTGEKLEVGRFTFDKGEGAVEHAHPHEQIMYVISGRLKVEFPDETGEIGPGIRLSCPVHDEAPRHRTRGHDRAECQEHD